MNKLRECCKVWVLERSSSSISSSILDEQFEKIAGKHLSDIEMLPFLRPAHLSISLSKDTNFTEILRDIMDCFNIPEAQRSEFRFGIVGLHPCGDLSSILLNFFLECPQAKFVNLVSCCYFHLTSSPSDSEFKGYPLSRFVSKQNPRQIDLSYQAKELACHAIESHTNRIITEDYDHLKIHSYRAALEKIICDRWPERKHSGLGSIKHVSSFGSYCNLALKRLDVELTPEEIDCPEMAASLEHWRNVVIFYSLRLMLAPLVENVILNDRLLYLLENGE